MTKGFGQFDFLTEPYPPHPAHPAHPAHPSLHPYPTFFKAREAGQLPKFGMLVYTGQIDSYYAQLGMPT